MNSRSTVALALASTLLLSVGRSEPAAGQRRPARTENVLVLGDIEVDEPGKRIRRLQPLADFLAAELTPLAIERVDVVLAKDVDQLSNLMRQGEVDVYLDSPFPTVQVQARTGSRVILQRRVGTESEYHTVYITRRDSGISELGGLAGRVVGFQDRNSTSAFFLPALDLVERGFALESVGSPANVVAEDRVGVFFTGDEENTVALLRLGTLDAGVLSHQDFRDLPTQFSSLLLVIDRTPSAPRALVSVRADLGARLEGAVREALLKIDEQDRREMAAADAGRGWTWRFAEISPGSEVALQRMRSNLAKVSRALEADRP